MEPIPTTLSPKGCFAKLAIALAASHGDYVAALDFAKQWQHSAPQLERVLKAAIVAGTTSDANWARETVDFRRLSREFVNLLRPATIIGRLQGMRSAPFNTRTLREIEAVNTGWVGEGRASPISAMALDETSITSAKQQASIVVTDELVRTWTLTSEASLERAMVQALAAALDRAFIDPTIAETSDGPASITHDAATSIVSTGNSTVQATADLKALALAMIAAGSDLSTCAWVVHPRTALALSLMVNAAGQFAFPKIGPLGGELLGLPAITSGAVPIDTGDDTYISLIDAQRIIVADEGLAAVDVSRQSSLQMLTNPVTGAAQLVSLWASGLVALRLTRWVRWEPVDANATAVLRGVSY